jgi:hypothetical protein
LLGVKELPLSAAAPYVPRLSKYISHLGQENVQVFYVAVSYKVKEETKYQLNGANYFIKVFVKEYGHWRIAESTVAPTNRLIEAGLGFGTMDEKEYMKRRSAIK